MTRLWMGKMADGKPAVRIMKNDSDEPRTTPQTDYGKFQFDSLTTAIGYVNDIYDRPYDGAFSIGGNGTQTWFRPSGSNQWNCEYAVRFTRTGGHAEQMWLYPYDGFDTGYTPILEARYPTGENKNIFPGPGSATITSGSIGHIGSAFTTTNYEIETIQYWGNQRRGFYSVRMVAASDRSRLVSIFDLPADETPLPTDGTATAGQEAIRFSPAMARVAKPGFTVTDADPKNFILHENYIPAKILASGDISVPSGDGSTATITLPAGFTITPLTYMDFIARRNGDTYFYNPPWIYNSNTNNDAIAFRYQVNSDSILITNMCRFSLVIRYMVLADSDEPFTTGGSEVMRPLDDGNFQIKRPGSSDSAPNLNDIMLDTRLTYLPILKEGFLTWPGDFTGNYSGGDRMFGERYVDVPVPNTSGMKLFVKHMLRFAERSYSGSLLPKQIYSPTAEILIAGSTWSGRMTYKSSYARIDPAENSVRFSMAGGNPDYIDGSGDPVYPIVGTPGLRYYVFGIPA